MEILGKKILIKRKYVILTFILFVIIGSDQLTKDIIVQKFRLGQSLVVISNFFNITYVQNKGAAFGFLSQADPAFRVPFFVIVPLIALLSIGLVFRKIADYDLKFSIALSLVIAGAIGNLIDRLRLGYVIDFLDFHWRFGYHFPAFNIADSAICVGVGLIMLDLFTSPATEKKKTASHSDDKGAQINASSAH